MGRSKKCAPWAVTPLPLPGSRIAREREMKGGIVFYSVRGKDGVLFEVLDDDLNVVGTLNIEDFIGAWKEQKNA
jgi:hypothetical protein